MDGRPLNQKTINRWVIIMLHGIRRQGAAIVMNKGDWPKTIDKKVEMYQPEGLNSFFADCDPAERFIFQIFFCTGFRDQEVPLWRGRMSTGKKSSSRSRPSPNSDSHQRTTKSAPCRFPRR